jgi:basic membrane protein A
MMKRVDNSVYGTIKDFIEGKFEGGYRIFGLEDDGVGYAVNEFNKELISDIQAKLDELKDKVINGEIKVPADKNEYEEFLKTLE